jgi:hypothetical protein
MEKRKYDIIDELAKNKTIEEIIGNIAQNPQEDTLKDLSQILYEDLLMKDGSKIVKMYEEDQLNYFITRMVLNSIKSKTSRYYYLFSKFNKNTQELNIEDEQD